MRSISFSCGIITGNDSIFFPSRINIAPRSEIPTGASFPSSWWLRSGSGHSRRPGPWARRSRREDPDTPSFFAPRSQRKRQRNLRTAPIGRGSFGAAPDFGTCPTCDLSDRREREPLASGHEVMTSWPAVADPLVVCRLSSSVEGLKMRHASSLPLSVPRRGYLLLSKRA